MSHSPAEAAPETPSRGQRLDSWKEIAAYLHRDIRTVRRWEKAEGLPVHRHVHDERGTAYAYSAEFDEWLKNRTRLDNAPGSDAADPAAQRRRSRRRARVLWGIIAAVVVLAALSVWPVRRAAPRSQPLSSLAIVFGPSQRFPDWGPDVALSPDGSTLVYTARQGGGNWQLYARRLDELEGHALEGTEGGVSPFFSPDGRWIGFLTRETLMKISIEGGAPVALAGAGFRGAADWSAHGEIVYANIAADGSHGLFRVSANGGAPTLISTLDGAANETYWLTPQWLPGGRAILCTIETSSPAGAHYRIAAISVDTGERRWLIDHAKHGLYLGDGILVYERNDALFATWLDLARLEVSGPQVPAWDNVSNRVRFRSWTHAAGTLVYFPGLRSERRLGWVDRSGRTEVLAAPPALYRAPRLSPDGQSVAVIIGGEYGNVWKYDLVRSTFVQLTSDSRISAITWTPDGSRLTVSSSRGGTRDILQLSAVGAGEPERVVSPSSFFKWPSSWVQDGKTLVFVQFDPASKEDLWAVTPGGGREPLPVVRDPGAQQGGHVSPDGRWIAYSSSNDTNRAEVHVTPFPGGGPKWLVSADGGREAVWARSGRELFYRSGDRMMSVPVTITNNRFTPGRQRMLFEGPYHYEEPGSPNFDVSLDDQRFLMVLPGSTEGPDRLNVIQAWNARLQQRLRDLGPP